MTSREYLYQLIVRPLPRQRLLALLMVASITLYLLFHSSDSSAASPFSPPWDKLAHFTFFAGLSCLAWVMAGRSQAWRVLALIAAIGASDEVIQSFNPSRVGDLTDWAADMTGAVAAVVLLTLLARLLTRRRSAVQSHPAHARP